MSSSRPLDRIDRAQVASHRTRSQPRPATNSYRRRERPCRLLFGFPQDSAVDKNHQHYSATSSTCVAIYHLFPNASFTPELRSP